MKLKHLFLSLILSVAANGLFAQRFQVPYTGTIAVEDYIYVIPKHILPSNFSISTHSIQHGRDLFPIEKSTDIHGNETFISIIDITTDRRGRVVVPTVSLVRRRAEYPKRTFAEITHKTGGKWVRNPRRRQFEYSGGEWLKTNYIRVPDNHTDRSNYIKYEGPGWESDKIGYRFYLDWRNAVSIFGKTKPYLILHEVGIDGNESYHNMQHWGMDILKVDRSLGVGSFGYWTGNRAFRVEIYDSIISRITADGKLRSQVKTTYFGWDYNDNKNKVSAGEIGEICVRGRRGGRGRMGGGG